MKPFQEEIDRLSKLVELNRPEIENVSGLVEGILLNAQIPVGWEEIPAEKQYYQSELKLNVWIAGRKLGYRAFVPEALHQDRYRLGIKRNIRTRMAREIIDLIDPLEQE